MANFNFGSFAAETTENSNNYLRAYNIYENVKFDGISDPTTGSGSNGNWTRYELSFSCPQGTFKKSIFAPKSDKDTERGKYTNANGHETPLPSSFEQVMELLKYVGKTFNPEGLAKLQKVSGKITSFEQFIETFKKCIGTPDVTTTMKLGGRNNQGTVYADTPKFLAINSKTGQVFINNPWLGDNVELTSWELSKQKELSNAKPTNMASKESDEPTTDTSASDDSMDDLLADI